MAWLTYQTLSRLTGFMEVTRASEMSQRLSKRSACGNFYLRIPTFGPSYRIAMQICSAPKSWRERPTWPAGLDAGCSPEPGPAFAFHGFSPLMDTGAAGNIWLYPSLACYRESVRAPGHRKNDRIASNAS